MIRTKYGTIDLEFDPSILETCAEHKQKELLLLTAAIHLLETE
jgi:hypothetical protein